MKIRVAGKWQAGIASVVIAGATFASALGISGPAAVWLNGYYNPVKAQASSQLNQSGCIVPPGGRCCGIVVNGRCQGECIRRGQQCP